MLHFTSIGSLRKVFLMSASLALLSGIGCSGQTDGGTASDNTVGDQFVSDGGAGAKMILDTPATIGVGEKDSFSVKLLDPQGQPLGFVRIFCESEKGIAIIEPSSGGVAFEHTGADGFLSGVLGGLLPGSYIIECRAPEGFNLVARKTIKIVGDVPPGFAGFPGAAGGNLGGGVVVDPPADADGAVVITQVQFTDAGGTTEHGPIDTVRTADCDPDPDPAAVTIEPFTFTNYVVTVLNNSIETITIKSVKFDIGSASTTTLSQNVIIDPSGDTGGLNGVLIDFPGSVQSFVGTGDPVPSSGTRTVKVTVKGVSESGKSFTVTGRTSLTFGDVDNCGA